MKIEGKKILHTDVLIIGGGTAGCYAAMTIREQSDYSIIIAEKANIKRSGCLAAGVNALNAYITKGHVPQDYVDYATKDADGIVRPDLLLTMSEGLNRVTAKMEQLGLVILKDENGEYVARGNRNIKINGELVPNGDFKKTWKSKEGKVYPAHFWLNHKAQYIPDGGKDGSAAILVNHDNSGHYTLKNAEAGKAYTIQFTVKAAEAPMD